MRDITSIDYPSPIGTVALGGAGDSLERLRFGPAGAPEMTPRPAILARAAAQLDEYFAGERRVFDLPLRLAGTEFHVLVWEALRRIPYGETTTYGRLALELSEETGEAYEARAVGGAVARTPVPIIVPCHRVIGADGSLTGYGGGLPRKRALLDFEASGGNPAALREDWVAEQLALV
jgi:methylated-DNA-[protein]-cysteine S-methyltransferase